MTTKREGHLEGGSGAIRKALLALLGSLLTLSTMMALFAPKVEAAEAVGPIGPHGYPIWYEDSSGLRLEICLDQSPLCLEPADDPSVPPTPETFPDEAFWWAGEAEMDLDGGGDALLVLAREAAFGGADEEIRDGDQVSFSRVRIRATVPVAGATYRVTHPYGVETFQDVPGGRRGINFTEDIGCVALPCDFAEALDGRVDPFLVWDDMSGLPAGFVGDPALDHTVVGSPIADPDHPSGAQNYFKIEQMTDANGNPLASPRIVGETDLFSIQGKISGLAVFPGPRGGEYGAAQSVSLTASDPEAQIFWTLDGSDPTPQSNPYTGPINVASTSTLKFIPVNGQETSQVFTERYVIRPATATTLDTNRSKVKLGGLVRLSGKLSSDGAAVSGKQVVILKKPKGAKKFTQVGTRTTRANGSYVLRVKPRKTTVYRAVFRGEAEGFQRSVSAPKKVRVIR